MSILERMTEDLTTAMKSRDIFRTGTLRYVIGTVRTAEKAGKVARTLTEDEVIAILVAEVKKRRETAQIFTDAGEHDRAANEIDEAAIIEGYLPEVLESEELEVMVRDVVTEVGATSMKDMGKVMKAVTARAAELEARVDGKELSGLVRAALSA